MVECQIVCDVNFVLYRLCFSYCIFIVPKCNQCLIFIEWLDHESFFFTKCDSWQGKCFQSHIYSFISNGNERRQCQLYKEDMKHDCVMDYFRVSERISTPQQLHKLYRWELNQWHTYLNLCYTHFCNSRLKNPLVGTLVGRVTLLMRVYWLAIEKSCRIRSSRNYLEIFGWLRIACLAWHFAVVLKGGSINDLKLGLRKLSN